MSPSLRLARWLYRALLLVYPAGFRRRDGDEVTEVFLAMCRERWRRDGVGAVVSLWARTFVEVPRRGLAERRGPQRPRGPLQRRGSGVEVPQPRDGSPRGRRTNEPGVISMGTSAQASPTGPPGTDPRGGRPSPVVGRARVRRSPATILADLATELRQAARSHARAPGFAAAVVATLALGMGANTAIFSVVNSLILNPLSHEGADRIVFLSVRLTESGWTISARRSQVELWRQRLRSFERLEVLEYESFLLTGAGMAENVGARRASPGFLPALGIGPRLGRLLADSDAAPGAAPVAVLGEALWRRKFAADRAVVGRPLTLDGVVHTIVGVVPEPEIGIGDVWLPLTADPEAGAAEPVQAVGWLQPGVDVETAREELAAVSAAEHDTYGPMRGILWRPGEAALDHYGTILTVLMGAVSFVLLIACANVASLVLARSTGRRRELAVRAALGAGRGAIVRHLLVEGLVLAAIGGGLGLALAVGGVDLMAGLAPGSLQGQLQDVRIDRLVLAWAAGLALVTGAGVGLLPALRPGGGGVGLLPALRPVAGGLQATLRGDPRSGRGTGALLLRRGLVALEVAVSTILLVGAGLLVATFLELQTTDPGFEPDGLVSLSVWLPEDRYGDEVQTAEFSGRLLAGVRALPGVEAAVLADGVPPVDTVTSGTLEVPGQDGPGDRITAARVLAGPGYFEVMGIPLRAGRGFTDEDVAAASRGATIPLARAPLPSQEVPVVVNVTFADRYLAGGNPVGARFRLGSGDRQTSYRVVGVAGDVAQLGLDLTVRDYDLQIYGPLQTAAFSTRATVLARAAVDPAALFEPLRALVRELDPELPISSLDTVSNRLAGTIDGPRFNATLLGAFALLALALAAVGISGVVAHSVSQRTRELGVRMALGARAGEVQRLVLGQAMLPVLAGIAAGLAGALALGRVMTSLLSDVAPGDPVTLVGTAAALLAVALVAAWLPARRATRIDPVLALRSE